MSTRQPVTINDVARAAQVSVSTVSNVLTGNRPVAAKTRQQVLQVVEALGFRPNRLARGLVSRSSKTIGIVASGLEYFGPSRTLVGMEQEASERGYSLLLSLIHDPATEEIEPIVTDLLAHQVDGIIWAIPQIGHNRTWWLNGAHPLPIPVVFLNHQTWPGLVSVDIDNCYGAQLATTHLLESGRQQIGLIAGPSTWYAANQRQKGWASALQAAGKASEPRQIMTGDWSPQSGEQAFYALMKRYPEMDALFVSNDQMAIGAMRAASDLNLRIPEDIAVVGFDDIPEAAFTRPRLTTVRQQVVELGRLAVTALLELIDSSNQQEEQQHNRLLQPSLIVRESSQRLR
ncbi:MAG: LacI family DNA-binding transcriptional regulator [Caldilineaceae bacterium]|jgi:LacI family transcriptional regulator|nr:LacI family DNA-binding transcriptional regulator [Caldilineaceae bacterium]